VIGPNGKRGSASLPLRPSLMHLELPAVSPADLALPPPREGSRRWPRAWPLPAKSSASPTTATGFAAMPRSTQLLDEVATPDAEGRGLLASAAGRFKLPARGYHRVLRVSRTLADLDSTEGSAACMWPRR
jgi:magnesium chelatase family protein